MLKRVLAKFRPTPSMAVALFGVAIALGSSGYAANGGNFLLGLFNSATQRTALVANFNGSALQVNNTSAAASAVPLQLMAAAGHPPMKVNTVTKVTNFNADYVDGLDAATLTRVMRIPFNLAPGATQAITLPQGIPVHFEGAMVGSIIHFATGSDDGIGVATLVADGSAQTAWTALDWGAPAYHSAIYLPNSGVHIVWIDPHQLLDVTTGGPNKILLSNIGGAANETIKGAVTLTW